MAKQASVLWRESASLIMLAKNKSVPQNTCDYRALLFSRAEKSSFMPSSTVFPGGVCEAVDASPLWLKHFQSLGVQQQRLQQLTNVSGLRPSIFAMHGEGCLEKEISLRITAIRETFEEVGVILCRDKHNIADGTGYGQFKEDFDRAHWQHAVHNDPAQFLTLCKELQIVPDLWSLHEWSAWLTPATFKKRFETAFYMVAMQETPKVLIEENEGTDYTWKSPHDYISAYLNKEIWLPPPQLYELSRMLNIAELEQLLAFASKRAKNGTTLILPVQRKCNDGQVHLLPGDEMYPSDPNSQTEFSKTGLTIAEYRAQAQQLHRSEHINRNECVLQLNFPLPDGQLAPVNIDNKLHKL